MIKADPGWFAQFEYGGETENVPIVGWSTDGRALVVEWSTGSLVNPTDLRDKGSFRRVVREHIYATVPGITWTLRANYGTYRDEDWRQLPVASFDFYEDGRVFATTFTSDGTPQRFRLGEEGIYLVAPAATASVI